MRQKIVRLLLVACVVAGLSASTAWADLGLKQISDSQGLAQVGVAVSAAVAGIYSSTDDAAEIKRQIVEILNEAARTGDEQIVRYTIAAALQTGGADNLDLGREAINDSEAFVDFPNVVASTVSTAISILSGSGSGAGSSGGSTGDSTGTGGNGSSDNPLDSDGDANITDNDVPGTPT